MLELNSVTRIDWVDIFKGITIISVVIGHATGQYNMYIYQFHMAAFFFISGYTTNLNKKNLFQTIWDKFFTIILPLLTIFFLMLGFLYLLIYSFPDYNFNKPFDVEIKFIIYQFFSGTSYISWLGATWFLVVLFFVVIIQKVLYIYFKNNFNYYTVASFLLFLWGYYIIANHIGSYKYFDLVLVAQFYFFIGIYFRNINLIDKLLNNDKFNLVVLIVVLYLLYFFGNIYPTTVDYPSRRFGFAITDFFAALNGIFFIYLISFFFSKIYILKKILVYVGKNTLSIVFFHFLFFKLAFLVLFIFGEVNISYLEQFIPTPEVSRKYFLLISIISIICSILFWKIITQIKFLKFFLGENKDFYSQIYFKLSLLNYFKINLGRFKLFTFFDLKKIVIDNKIFFILYTFLVLVVSLTYINQGIMWNDELQRYFTRKEGFSNLIFEGIKLELSQGRPMRIMAALNNSFSFITTNMYINKIFQLFSFFINIGLFSYLIYIVFNNKVFSFLILVFIIGFLPISFEPTLPNAYVTLISIPMSLLLLSFIMYIKYTCNFVPKYQYFSMFLFFIAMMSYEFIVTFVFIYTCIYFYNRKSTNFNLRIILFPYAIAIIYVILLFGLKYIFPTNYDGVSISFVSLQSSFDIIFQLIKSSLPTYYLFNSKYQYLLYMYADSDFYLSNFIFYGFNLISFLTIKNFILFIIVFCLLKIILDKYSNEKRVGFSSKWIFFLLVYLCIPSLPNSIAKMYQGNVSPDSYAALPVSYFLFFISILLSTYLFVVFMQVIRNKEFRLLIIFIVSIIILCIQISNDIFSKEQNRNFTRMKNIEYLFNTNFIKNLNDKEVFANDLYITKNGLAFQDNYWTRFAIYKHLNIKMNTNYKEDINAIKMYYPSQDYFVVIKNNQLVVLSRKKLVGIISIKTSNNEYINGNFEQNYEIDSIFYRYDFEIVNEKDQKILRTTNSSLFNSILNEVGSNLKESHKIIGYHNDGWIEQNSIFKIRTKELGTVIFDFFYPNDILSNEKIEVFVDDLFVRELYLKKGIFREELINLQSNSEIKITIRTNFLHKNNNNDIRKLSLILNSMEGK